MRLTVLIFLISSFGLYGQNCNYLAYEPFDYQANIPLNATQGGSGWSAPWDVQNGNVDLPGFQTANTSPMQFADLQTRGGYMTGGHVYLTAGRKLNVAGAFADYRSNAGDIGKPGTTLWMSALLRKSSNNGESIAVYYHNSGVDWCTNCAGQKFAMGYFGSASDVNGQRRWSLFLRDVVIPTEVPVVPNETAFLVLRVDFAAAPDSNVVRLYVNPAALGSSGEPAPNAVLKTTQPIGFHTVAIYPGNIDGAGAVDELRIGASWACVAPDAGISVNQAPVAAFSITPPTGTAPLQAVLDAGASFDPDGSIVSYQWNFGDGTAPGTGIVVNHTFVHTGHLNISLSVTDNNGVQHVVSQPITVLNSSGTFGCQANVSGNRLSSCGEADGAISLGGLNGQISATLLDLNGNVIAPAQGNSEYDHLAPGPYTLLFAGTDGCRDTFHIRVPVDSADCAGWQPDSCGMKIGVGLEGFAYYSTSRVFKDYFKSVGNWITFDPTNAVPGWDTGDLQYAPFDSRGYPTQAPFPTPNGMRALRGVVSANGFMPVGTPMRLLYDGEGSLTMQGQIAVTSAQPGQIDFSATGTDNIWFHLNESKAVNPIRNIRIVAVSDLDSYQTQPFRENFLEKAGKFSALRFMDWMGTNGNRNTDWAHRTLPDHFSQSITANGGVAYEYIIQLANHLHKDIWICIPHLADDDYVAQMAAMFRDQLSPEIHVYLEYSNEVWNWIFEQAHWVAENGPQNLSYPRRYVERATHVFGIWTEVWGAQKNRLKRVLGTQAGYDWITAEIMAQARPEDYDYISPSWYVGLAHDNSGNPNLVALGADATAEDVLENAHNVFLNQVARWRMVNNLAKLYGKKVVNYEGGQHFTNFTVPAYIQAMYEAQTHPRMYDLYQEMLDTLRSFGSEMPFAFVMTGPQKSVYGSWGHIFDDDDPAPWNDRPKFQVLLDNICQKQSGTNPEFEPARAGALLYPNPAQDRLNVSIPEQWAAEGGRMLLMEPGGRVLQQYSIDYPAFSIPLPLQTGLYFVRFEDKTGRFYGINKLIVADKR